MKNKSEKVFFSEEVCNKIRDRFCYVESDPLDNNRLYFENAGGALTLKEVQKLVGELTAYPDSSGRPSKASKYLGDLVAKGKEDIKLILGVKKGKIFISGSASRVLTHMSGAIIENVAGSNVVTTNLEHPGNYDAANYYANKTGKELRVAEVNPKHGGVDPEAILEKVDKDTCLLSFIYSSNINGVVLDAERIIKEARAIKPDLFVLVDAVQHAPHAAIDVERLGVDAMAIGPYKLFSNRGFGLGYLSERASVLPHEKTLGKPKDEWDLGGLEHANYGGLSLVADYFSWLGGHFTASTDRRTQIEKAMEAISAHEKALLDRFLHGTDDVPGLAQIDNVVVHFMEEEPFDRDCVLAINIQSDNTGGLVDSGKVTDYYSKNGIIVYDRVASNPLSKRTLDAFNLAALIRVSPGHYNTATDIDAFLKVTAKMVDEL